MTGIRKDTGISGAAATVIAITAVAVVALLLHSGNMKAAFKDTSLKISAPFWTDLNIRYSEIDAVSYRGELDVGERTVGIGSARLSVGRFQNKEFGAYTLYAYTDAKAFVVFTSNGRTFAIGMRSAEDAQAVYDALLKKTGE